MDQNYQKLNKFIDRSKSNLGLFLGNFSNLGEKEKKWGGWGSNPWQPKALIPYDAGRVARSSRIDVGEDEHTQEHEEHEEHTQEHTNTNPIQ